MRRRTLLLAASAAFPLPALAAPRRPVLRRLAIRHAATGDRFAGPWHDGRTADPAAMAELSQVLADTRTGAILPFDPAAIEVLWEVARRANLAGELTILSGYRTPQTNTAVHGAGDSQHLRAGAVDVMLASDRLGAFAEQAVLLGRGGVGVYQARGFVHVDSGPVRRWGDMPGALAGLPVTAGGQPRRLNLTFDPLASMAEAWGKTRIR
ncbi:YcbK family protein [Dankookia sp. GCM10030260]|uniref:YcbK family protein n=1 Tax=Dankookia sp. GCM10030260 TaxID=3273390 RepID=UPI003609F7CA